MSMPVIPGYLGPQGPNSLANEWSRPSGEFPEELWPVSRLNEVLRNPTGWVKVEEHFYSLEEHGGAGCVLVPERQVEQALAGTSWIGRNLGEVGAWDDGKFEYGLSVVDDELVVEFFVHARRPSGAKQPIVEVALPFLWYWDAFRTDEGWRYLNRAGREQELVRWTVDDDRWTVEVRALELRNYLATSRRAAILQRDYVLKRNRGQFSRVDDAFESQWAHFRFHALHDRSMGNRPAFSVLMGQYVLTGLRNDRLPRWEERRQDREYPSFIYGTDAETGKPLRHLADPDKLGTYFDKDGTRLHYLTPIYFKREVLQPYAAEPTRYRLSSFRLSCLDLWGIDLSFNSLGLIEVYLGDLGRDLPSEEWGHWLTYNVSPEGSMEEGRFRRDFLGQWASSPDPMGELRRARDEASEVSRDLLGTPIWRPLTGDFRAEFESLIGPLSDDPVALGAPLLTLVKAMIDAIDSAPLKSRVPYEKNDQSLRLLQRFAEVLGDEEDVTTPLRNLQAFRSRGGVAHLKNSASEVAMANLGISGMPPLRAFDTVVAQITEAMTGLIALMKQENG